MNKNREVRLLRPLTVVINTLLPNDLAETTMDVTNWRLHSDAKHYFNVYEFLEKINRLDVLRTHFDRMSPDLHITQGQFRILAGKPRTSIWQGRQGYKPTKLDEELILLVTNNPNEWDEVKDRRIDWRKQKIFLFEHVESFNY